MSAKQCKVLIHLFSTGTMFEAPATASVEETKYMIKKHNASLDFDEESIDLRLRGVTLPCEMTLFEISRQNGNAGMDLVDSMSKLHLTAVVDKEREATILERRRRETRDKVLDSKEPWRSVSPSEELSQIRITVRHKAILAAGVVSFILDVDEGCKCRDLCCDLTSGGPVKDIRSDLGLRNPSAYRKGSPLDRVDGLVDAVSGKALADGEELKDQGVYMLRVQVDIASCKQGPVTVCDDKDRSQN